MTTAKRQDFVAARSHLAGALRRLELALANDPATLGARIRAFAVQFQDYSPMNRVRIMAQRPDATYLKGRKQWAASGRTVKPRARAVRILAPAPAPGGPGGGVTFTEVRIYDVSDTIGPPFEPPAITSVQAHDSVVASSLEQLERWARGSGVELLYKPYPTVNRVVDGATDGVKIWVRPDLSPSDRLAVLAHEIAHVRLHFPKKRRGADLELDGPTRGPDRQERELQAELTSYFLLELSGVDSAASAAAYLNCWAVSRSAIQRNAWKCIKVACSVLREAERGTYRSIAPTRPAGPPVDSLVSPPRRHEAPFSRRETA